MTRVICLAGVIGLLLSTGTFPTVGCKQEAKTEKQTKINFGTGLAAVDEMGALSRAEAIRGKAQAAIPGCFC